jgi:glutathione peroxidase
MPIGSSNFLKFFRGTVVAGAAQILAILSVSAELPDVNLETLEGSKRNLREYSGQVLMIVNTASKCGFTPQYADLQKLFLSFEGQPFSVLGFPSNDFGEQEPGSAAEIREFCTSKFQITFPLFAKAPVSGSGKQPIFTFLTESVDPALKGEIGWNFEKFLLDKKGQLRARFGSSVNPMNSRITTKIKELLSAP